MRGEELGGSKFIDFLMLINIIINSALYFLKHFSISSPRFSYHHLLLFTNEKIKP